MEARRRYVSDLTDSHRKRLCHRIARPYAGSGPRCPQERWRKYVNAILYVNRTGCPWRMLPHDFGAGWSQAHKHFMRWARDGTWQAILDDLREEVRQSQGRQAAPSAGVVDSSSVKSTPVRGVRGFDGAKKVQGVKRHVVVDTLGLMLLIAVTAANVGDRQVMPQLVARVRSLCPTLRHLWADRGYTGAAASACVAAAKMTITIVGTTRVNGDFKVEPRRWVVERTFAWMNRCRRLTRQYEQTELAHEAHAQISQITLMLRRLDGLTEVT